ncbi:hypothetical protein SAMN05444422_102303 [Halobiforma haloterrestris]|uniref:Uncharacterized protein n=1 Tax=Natronobacterium haloterrestre TaxID=148448 RepID=A0A1I1EAP7_NATHA|nr:hypothetical protein SAMN05444422_102303 [Halobiforma haloterrestris]
MTTWAELFERGGEYDVSLERIREAAGDLGEEETGEEDGD